MGSRRRHSNLPITFISLLICLVLLASPLVPLAIGEAKSLIVSQGQSRKEKPVSGPPEVDLPNLNDVRNRRYEKPEAPKAIPSTIRSRRNPLESRNGRKLGDQIPVTVGSNATGGQHSQANASKNRSVKLNHARSANVVAPAPPPVGDDQYVQNFFVGALARQPQGYEQSYWNDIIRAAYARAQTSMVMAAREMGRTLFESAEYAGRNRNDHWYVYDLYKAYCMRDPDTGGWAYWESMVPSQGREAVRRAFDESGEFVYVVSTITPNGSASSAVSSLLSARVDPNNQPGTGLLARDAEWSLPLISLPGRSGLDLGLALSYSSMVWTRSGPSDHPYLYFDEDNGSPSPGFRLGFPTIQEKFFDAQMGQNVYLLITPAGGRHELRQVGTSSTYEAADSSYLQLIDYGSSLLVRPTDGTQLSYAKLNNEWRCSQVKDRNGNYLTVNYNWRGQITTIKDTLERLITFNYDGNANLQSITQSWNGQTHEWATFGWSNIQIQPNFAGSISGMTYGGTIPVLSQIGLADHSYYKFIYATSLTGQVSRVTHYASDSNPATDNHPLAYTIFDYETTASDCPRISATRLWAEYWNGANGVPSEVTTQYSDSGNNSRQMTGPDGTIYKEFYGTGWQNGLTTLSEVWSAGVRQKWTTIAWTQDNTALNYQLNPRVTETNILDASGNRRRTTIDYHASFGLPLCVTDFGSDAATVIRFTVHHFKWDAAYIDRRIIGLPDSDWVFDGSWNLYSRMHYGYDSAPNLEALPNGANAVQHDSANYGINFVYGRGNLSAVTRLDVTDPDNSSKNVESKFGHNITGSLTFTRDMLWHQNFLSYADSFSDGINNRNTFAYPTTISDSDWNGTYLRYNYDFGAKTRHKGPPAAGQAQGAVYLFEYDSAARLQKEITEDVVGSDDSYTRYAYGPNYLETFSTINSFTDEGYGIRVTNGFGQDVTTASNHPGSAGGFKAQSIKYDLMGRVSQESNPAEVNASWVPYGDDAIGWLYSQRFYDWKGRLTDSVNIDWTQQHVVYSGCGCAGGEVATYTDEVFRKQREYRDVEGRIIKTEVLAGEDVYTAVTNTYNPLNQVVVSNSYQGAATSDGSCPVSTCQQTSMTYDGHGRLKTKHIPEQNPGTSISYEYLADDSPYKVTDARGASATYSYNTRQLLSGITYDDSPYGVSSTPDVTFTYDAAGNRTGMTDGAGVIGYSYDRFSRMTSETRTLNGLGSFTLSYQYNLANEVTNIADPFGGSISYGFDNAGRLNSANGSGYGAISQFASNIKYRAWGGMKSASYSPSRSLSIDYSTRMQPTLYRIIGPYQTLGEEFQYYPDGQISYSRDLNDSTFDRSYSYDHVRRLISAFSGSEARGGSAPDGPYRQTYSFDSWGNLTQRTGRDWSHTSSPVSFSYNPATNRNSQWTYDADGRVTVQGTRQYFYDAAARQTHTVEGSGFISQEFDGDGQLWKSNHGTPYYYLRSTVLNGVTIAELNNQGQVTKRFIYGNGKVLAEQLSDGSVSWKYRSPSNSTQWSLSDMGGGRAGEYDPLGSQMGVEDPYSSPGGGYDDWRGGGGVPSDLTTGCSWEGMSIGCEYAVKITAMRGGKSTVTVRTIPGVGVHKIETFHTRVRVVGDCIGCNEWSKGLIETFISTPKNTDTTVQQNQKQNPLKGVTGGVSAIKDPCSGVQMSDLDFNARGSGGQTGLEHITERHIEDTNSRYHDSSKYIYYSGFGSRLAGETDPQKRLIIAQQAVVALDLWTFRVGGRYQATPSSNISFVYGLPHVKRKDFSIDGFTGVVGAKWPHAGELTNMNTLILAPDCRRVITSFPGLPSGPWTPGGGGSPIYEPK
jgi:YD repeat-containing protein